MKEDTDVADALSVRPIDRGLDAAGVNGPEPCFKPRTGERRAPAMLFGRSPSMRAALRELPAIIESSAAVLVLGESGTGKELLSRHIHEMGPRRDGPFVALNCAAIPDGLLESELFGHAAGSFSGAVRAKRGLLECADGGTVLLDEIGDMPAAFQAKLLRVLEDGIVRRVGEVAARRVDFRLIAATHRNLEADAATGRFRMDLLYRIRVFSLLLPPLRQRVEDLPELAAHLVALAAARLGRPRPAISAAALDGLSRQPWAGNVRELGNALERAVALAREGVIEPRHLGFGAEPAGGRRSGRLRRSLAALEREMVAEALASTSGVVSRAARELGIARQQLQRLMRRHGLGAGTTR